MTAARKNRRFLRREGILSYRRRIVISGEGENTEPEYFQMLGAMQSSAQIVFLKKHHKSAPGYVLQRLMDYLRRNRLVKEDEAWAVIDKDSWREGQIKELVDWANSNERCHLALSNPKFEYWLLLHFEGGRAIRSSRNCTDRLKVHLPDYDKGISARNFPIERVMLAIDRAEQKDRPPCEDWPHRTGTTVYRLARSILRDSI